MSAFSVPKPNGYRNDGKEGGNSWQVSYRVGGGQPKPSEEEAPPDTLAASNAELPKQDSSTARQRPDLKVLGSSSEPVASAAQSDDLISSATLPKVGT